MNSISTSHKRDSWFCLMLTCFYFLQNPVLSYMYQYLFSLHYLSASIMSNCVLVSLKSLIKLDTHVHVAEEKSLLKCISFAHLELVISEAAEPRSHRKGFEAVPLVHSGGRHRNVHPPSQFLPWEHSACKRKRQGIGR